VPVETTLVTPPGLTVWAFTRMPGPFPEITFRPAAVVPPTSPFAAETVIPVLFPSALPVALRPT
jgi:hypothetical protein